MSDDLDTLIAETLRIPAARVSDSLSFQGLPEWDSVGHLNLVLALEERLETRIPDEVVVELTSVAAIRAWVRSVETKPNIASA